MISSALGGYLAGRLRSRWVGVPTTEVHFRDSAYGFLAWALASVLGAILLASPAASCTDCPAIDGLIKESDETAGEVEDKSVLDAAIIANAQAVEHYEIARYGTLIAWAEELGHDDIVRFLTTNLNEEKAAKTKLNTVALRKGVNRKAAS